MDVTKDKLIVETGNIFDRFYDKALEGVEELFPPVELVAEEYMEEYGMAETAAEKLLDSHIRMCMLSGLVTGIIGNLGLPADLAASLYFQMRMTAAAARLGGLDPKDAEVRKEIRGIILSGIASAAVKYGGYSLAKKTGPVMSILGGIIGGGINLVETKLIARVSFSRFIMKEEFFDENKVKEFLHELTDLSDEDSDEL